MKVTHDEIIRKTASRLDLPDKQVRFVMVDFFAHLRRTIQYPEDYFHKGIRIKNCFKISINPAKVLRNYFNLINKNRPVASTNEAKVHKFNKILLNNGCYSQKQEKAQNYNERHQKRLISETGKYSHYIYE